MFLATSLTLEDDNNVSWCRYSDSIFLEFFVDLMDLDVHFSPQVQNDFSHLSYVLSFSLSGISIMNTIFFSSCPIKFP